jgi:hypothetical protein
MTPCSITRLTFVLRSVVRSYIVAINSRVNMQYRGMVISKTNELASYTKYVVKDSHPHQIVQYMSKKIEEYTPRPPSNQDRPQIYPDFRS